MSRQLIVSIALLCATLSATTSSAESPLDHLLEAVDQLDPSLGFQTCPLPIRGGVARRTDSSGCEIEAETLAASYD